VSGQVTGKVALVTGGASGIGRAAAIALAREGANVALADVDAEGGAETVRAVEAAGGAALFVSTDVSRADAVEALIAETVQRFGRLDCAVNNAGIQGELNPTDECSEENWNRIIGINLTGVWLCMKYEIARMREQGSGAIVNVASNFGFVGSPGMPAYSAAKHGVLGLTKTAALEYAQSGIRVNAVCPGPVQTPLVDNMLIDQPEAADEIMNSITRRLPMGRIGQPEEIGEAIMWLCSDGASFATGVALPVDGGFVAQ
jgi:NAD(P)-dependent dehydrogenase (short-subunit alcohol dehydrogenase family)